MIYCRRNVIIFFHIISVAVININRIISTFGIRRYCSDVHVLLEITEYSGTQNLKFHLPSVVNFYSSQFRISCFRLLFFFQGIVYTNYGTRILE